MSRLLIDTTCEGLRVVESLIKYLHSHPPVSRKGLNLPTQEMIDHKLHYGRSKTNFIFYQILRSKYTSMFELIKNMLRKRSWRGPESKHFARLPHGN